MDTKLKKWKMIVSCTVFFVGVSLLLTGGAALIRQLISAGWSGDGIRGIMEEDYQNTGDFRSYIQDCLADFIAMATGGETGTWFDGRYYYGGYSGEAFSETLMQGSVEEAADAVGTDSSDFLQEQYGRSGDGGEKTKEQREEEAKAYHEAIREDKNLYYRIICDGRELYSNMEGITWDKSRGNLPEGYNFLLTFDGEKVCITKDGEEQDIYGDGYYRGSPQWYVPGYRNFMTDEDMKKVQITMLAAGEPVYYSSVKYGKGGYVSTESGLYQIAEWVAYNRRILRRSVACFLAGAALAAAGFFFRRERKEAAVKIGQFTGKIWFEGKLLVIIFLAVGLSGAMRWPYFSELQEASYVSDAGGSWLGTTGMWAEMVFSPSGFVYNVSDVVVENPAVLLILFWLTCLLVNDICKNRGHFFDGPLRRTVRMARTAELKQPFAVQTVRRFVCMAIVSIVFVLMALLLALLAFEGITNAMETILAVFFSLAGFLWIYYRCISRARRQAEEIDLLAGQIAAVRSGDCLERECLSKDSGLRQLSEDLAEIRQGMQTAVGEQIKSERMKVELVTNVSHDIRTPLTSIISYVQFLKQEEGLPEHVMDYIRILDEKSQRLNSMVQDVFAVSKAASGQLPVDMEELDFGKLLRQTLADMEEQIRQSTVTVKAQIPEHAVLIFADGGRMYRVFQNLIQNALKYSLEGSRVFVTLKEEGGSALAGVKNTSRQELYAVGEFTDRFVRGDESRTDGGSGLGLSIAKSFTEACGGAFAIETNADLFMVTVGFRIREQR